MNVIQIRSGGEVYHINDKGEITTTKFTTPSGKWKLVGAVEFGRGTLSAYVLKSYTFDDILANRVPWWYKNRKQRCYVKDFDHGSHRVWMSPALRSVWIAGVGYVKGCHMNPFKRGEGRS